MSRTRRTIRETLTRAPRWDILGRIAESSNGTFLVDLLDEAGTAVRAVYKPETGERPLGDFPPGIWRREVAAYELAADLGWECIPETVAVEGPYGRGSLQRFVEVDYDDHYFTLVTRDDPSVEAQLRRLCCFDLIANNTDRKSGHCIVDVDDHVWGIDNALCFHALFKLRTVIWDFAGEQIDSELLGDLADLGARGLPDTLTGLLDRTERDALATRIRAVVAAGVFPHDPTGRRYPWPLV